MTVVAPVYVLVPPRVSVPVPFLTSDPVVVPMTPPIEVLPLPATVSVRVAPPTPPIVRVPPSEVTVALPDPIVTVPDQPLALARLRSAPVPPTPVPMALDTVSAIVRFPSHRSRWPPRGDRVAPAVVPSAVECWTRTTPALIVVTPVYVLAPARVSVPLPFFTSVPGPRRDDAVDRRTARAADGQVWFVALTVFIVNVPASG